MEILWVLVAGAVVLGPWALAIAALVRANRAIAEAERASAAASAAWRAARPALEPLAPAVAPPTYPPPAPAPPDAVRAPPAPLATTVVPPPPPPPAPPPRPATAAATPPITAAALEEKIALVWFTRAGALAVLLGAAYFLKYAIDNAWLGPWGRVALACVGGVAALVAGEALRPRTRAAWIHALQGAGLALLFLAAFASHALYHLVPAAAAFAAVGAVALLGGALALRHRGELLLGLAVAGGLLAPVLLSTGEDRPLALFGYLLVLGGATLAVSVRAGFRVVPWLAMAGTVALFAGWYDRFFQTWGPPAIPNASLPLDEQMGRYHPLARRAIPLGAVLAFAAAWLVAHRRFRASAPRAWSDAWLCAALLFAHAAPFALLADRTLLAGAVLAVAALAAAILLAEAGRPALVIAAEAVAFGLLAFVADGRGARTDGAVIAAAALAGAVHLGAVARAWLLAREQPSPARTGAAAVAGLGFAAFAIAFTGPKDGVLRAALVGAAGAAELALGAAVLARARTKGTVLLGAALALLAGAAAFLLSGASVTVAWAALGAIAAVLGARERDRLWIGGACAVLAAAAFRALAVDLRAVQLASERFLSSYGVEGRLEPRLLLNPRALGLAAVAVGLLVAARAIARAMPAARAVAGVLAAFGWAFAIALAAGEARDLAVALPAPPPPGDAAVWEPFRVAVLEARVQQRGGVSAVTSLVLALSAALLVAGGFVFRDAFHRWLGLAAFGVVVAKLLLSDVWMLSRLQQVAVFMGVGALLLGAAFLYARYGKRIAALLRDEPPRGAGGAALGVVLLALAAPAHALDPSAFRVERPVDAVASPGLHAVEADADLHRASRAAPGSLADVRIAGPDGAEVPWALRVAPDPAERQVPGTVVDPVILPDGSVRAVVDLGRAPPRRAQLDLVLEGDEFLRPVRLEVSTDGKAFGVLSEGQRVWAIRDLPLARHTSVRHPVSEARFVRVTLLPGAGAPPRITGARAALDGAGPPPLRSLAVAVPGARRSADAKETFLDVDLGSPGLPVEAVELEAATPAYERHVRIYASADGAHWVPAGGGAVWRVPASGTGAPADDRGEAGVRVPASPDGRRWIRIAVQDGDSPPLAISAVRVLWRPRELVFRAERAGPHRLLAGADVGPPAYDLAALLARTGEAAVPAQLGPQRPNAGFREPEIAVPFTERHRLALSAVLAVLFAALAAWAVRLMRRPGGGGEAP